MDPVELSPVMLYNLELSRNLIVAIIFVFPNGNISD